MSSNKIRVLATVPSGFCFGLQHVTIGLFRRFTDVDSLFLVTKWNNGDFIKLLESNHLKYEGSWLGMFSRSLKGGNLKMSLHSLSKLPRLYYDFYKLLKTFKPNILYFANHHELILLYPVLKFTSIPVVCHMHDPSPAIGFQKKTFSFYNTVVDKFIAISDNVRKRTIELGCNPETIETIHNGIELPAQIRAERGAVFLNQFDRESDVFIVGITGQMTATKGHMDLLNAFKIAHRQNAKLRLVIGGVAMEPLYTELKKAIADEGMQNCVAFSGWQPSVHGFFGNIDLFVLASRHDEGYGLVVAEAMANGLPVIITNSGGAVEIVENGINGYIVPKRDVKLMAEKILALSTDPLLCTQMGVSGQQRIKTHFDLKDQARLLQNSLLKIAAK